MDLIISLDENNQKAAEDRNYRLKSAQYFLNFASRNIKPLSPTDLAAVRGLATALPLDDRVDADFLANLLKHWFATTFPMPCVLLAAMISVQVHDLPPPPPLWTVPDWLRADWLGFLLRQPVIFRQLGERERYFETFAAVLDRVHEAVVRAPLPDAPALGQRFTAQANPLACYFTHRNSKAVFRRWASILEAIALRNGSALACTFPPNERERPRIGFLLQALWGGTETSYLLAHLSPDLSARFDATLFVTMPNPDPALCRMVEDAGARVAIIPDGASDERAAWVRGYDLDLLLIASNCAVRGTLALLSMHRLARVQVVGAASPVSPGFTQHDVYLLGEGNVGADYAERCNERLYRMPGVCTHYAFGLDQHPATVEPSRAALGIAENAPLLISTANYYKLNPELIQLWARILWRVPEAVLLLVPFNPNWSASYQDDLLINLLRSRMIAHGVNPGRIRLLGVLPQRADVQRVVGMADVYLDSQPFGGACSMIDPLQCGVPVVVRDAPTFHGGIAASMLRDVGLADMVVADDESYVDMAVLLAKSAAERARAGSRIRDAVSLNQAFTRTSAYAGHFAQACHDLIADDRKRFRNRIAAPEVNRRNVTTLVERLVDDRSPWLRCLTDTQLIPLLILPYFQALGRTASEHVLIDVGACVGEFAHPFLSAGWHVHMLEPDEACQAALSALQASFPGQAHHHAVVAVDSTEKQVTFHRTVQGLSGLAPSPYAPTRETVMLPATRVVDLAVAENIRQIDILKVDAEGFDFRVLDGHDFVTLPPRLVMVEFGDMYAGQTGAEIAVGIQAMARRGYDALILSCDDDGNFQNRIWDYRVIAATFDQPRPNAANAMFGNIIFFRQDDVLLPTLFCALVERF